MVRDINPYADVRVFTEGINEDNVESFLNGVDVFIDGIDFFEIDVRRLTFKRSRDKGIYAITSAPLGFGATLQVFSSEGMTFDEYFGISDEMDYLGKAAAFASGLAPHPYHIRYMDISKVSLAKRTGPALALACTLQKTDLPIYQFLRHPPEADGHALILFWIRCFSPPPQRALLLTYKRLLF